MFSMARWFAGSSISRIHGQAREIDGTWYLPLYHPAAALHQQALRPTLYSDIAQLPGLGSGYQPSGSSMSVPAAVRWR